MIKTERILGPAIRVIEDNCIQAKIYTLPMPYSHKDIDLNCGVFDKTKVADIKIEYTEGIRMTDGFYTNERPFINRRAAMVIARLAFQIKHPWEENGDILFTNYLKGY